LEVCKSNNGDFPIDEKDIVRCVPGKFAIFGHGWIPIDEQILKAAG